MPVAPRIALARDTVVRARVTVAGAAPVVVENLTLHNDSLVGILPNSSPPGTPPLRFAAPADEAHEVLVRRHRFSDTLGAVVLGLGGVALSLYLFGF